MMLGMEEMLDHNEVNQYLDYIEDVGLKKYIVEIRIVIKRNKPITW
jgi:hypothetical protein